ncbi:PALP domain-containing protein [Micromonospora fluostatini]|uniref:hypothetical protein n=1 Tax=Micromonospora sp. JCM 30529 TaxID=3421643 RepID=UPI003D170B82
MADLDAVADAQRAVRDRPWPLWLYPANTLLLGVMALTPLLGVVRLGAWVVLGLAVFGLNYWAGHRIGTPFAVPTSRGFRVALTATALFLATAMITGTAGSSWLVVASAVGTMISYGVGSVFHHRSTRR